jgi:hypothetical protein
MPLNCLLRSRPFEPPFALLLKGCHTRPPSTRRRGARRNKVVLLRVQARVDPVGEPQHAVSTQAARDLAPPAPPEAKASGYRRGAARHGQAGYRRLTRQAVCLPAVCWSVRAGRGAALALARSARLVAGGFSLRRGGRCERGCRPAADWRRRGSPTGSRVVSGLRRGPRRTPLTTRACTPFSASPR